MVHLPLYYRYHRLASCAIACNDISVTGINKLIVEARTVQSVTNSSVPADYTIRCCHIVHNTGGILWCWRSEAGQRHFAAGHRHADEMTSLSWSPPFPCTQLYCLYHIYGAVDHLTIIKDHGWIFLYVQWPCMRLPVTVSQFRQHNPQSGDCIRTLTIASASPAFEHQRNVPVVVQDHPAGSPVCLRGYRKVLRIGIKGYVGWHRRRQEKTVNRI